MRIAIRIALGLTVFFAIQILTYLCGVEGLSAIGLGLSAAALTILLA